MNGTIFPSATMLQLNLQHRFLNTTQRIQRVSSDHNTSLPPTFLTFQSRNLSGSFYLIDDQVHSICIVNWTLGQTTGLYYTTARTLAAIIQEWDPLSPYFTHIHTNTSIYADLSHGIPTHDPVLFSLHIPRAFHLRFLTVMTSHTTVYIRMATSLTISRDFTIGTFSLYDKDTFVTRQHGCRYLTNTQLHLVFTY